MDFAEIRRLTITALFSDDVLYERLVLKGGNALSLVYGITQRTSLDLDFSMAADFDDIEDARRRIFRALERRFMTRGYVVFDAHLDPKPKLDGEDLKPWWGGYELRFKLMEATRHAGLNSRPGRRPIEALLTGPGQQRTFTVDFSKCEHVAGKAERELDEFSIFVYSPEMIVLEKLRAICQQMPEYEHRGRSTARARDFYDIYRVLAVCEIDLSAQRSKELLQQIFASKRVPLNLLDRVAYSREFHRPDWLAVTNTTAELLEEFDFYFEFVLDQIARLEPFGDEQSPL